jgi:hypothetical protein
MEKIPSFGDVVGNLSDGDKEKVVGFVEKRFEDQTFVDLVEGVEVEKSPEQLRVIELVNKATNEVVEQYGGEAFDIPLKNIHILRKEEYTKRGRDEEAGSFSPLTQAILIQDEPSLVTFAHKVFHEMLHFKSHHAVQLIEGDKPKIDIYRTGLVAVSRDAKKDYFNEINEAVVEELTLRHIKKLWSDPLFKETMERSDELVSRLDSAEDILHAEEVKEITLFGKVSSFINGTKADATFFSYPRQRKVLSTLISKIYERNSEAFKNKDEVFGLFAEGEVTGNLLTIGRLIENTFGKGTLRSLGEFTKMDLDGMEKFVEGL